MTDVHTALLEAHAWDGRANDRGIGIPKKFAEVWALNQLELSNKTLGLLDVDGYLQPFVSFVDELIGGSYLPSSLVCSRMPGPPPS